MRKFLWALGSFVILVMAAILIVPSAIDWSTYKDEIAAQAKKFTGRDLVIAGDIDVKLLPTPTLTAEKVSLSSVEGAQSPDFATLSSIEVRVALAPLLAGNVVIETVRLVEPQVYLEVLANGRSSWKMTPPAKDAAGNQPISPQERVESSGGPNITLNQFEIVDGTLSYHDAASGTDERVQDMDLEVAAASLTSGPFRANGSLVVRGLRLDVRANVGEIVEGRTFPLDTIIGIGGNSAELQLAGTVLGLNDAPRFRGDLSIKSDNIGRIVEAFSNDSAFPEPLRQPFLLSGAIDASQSALSAEKLVIEIGGATGTGSVSGSFNGAPRVQAQFDIDKIDIDPWIRTVEKTPSAATKAAPGPGKTTSPTKPEGEKAAGDSGDFTLPTGISVSLAGRIGEVAYNGDALRNLILNVDLANGELTLSQASMQAPGGTDLAMFGFVTSRNGKPAYDATLESRIREPRKLMAWADVDASFLKAGKPGALSLNGKIGGSGNTININDLQLAFDKTTVRGAATLVMGERLGVGASVAVNELDLDAYLAEGKSAPAKDAAPDNDTQAGGQSKTTPAPAPAEQTPGVFDGLEALTGFDANVRANVGLLKTNGVPIRNIEADLSLIAGDLTIRKFAIGDLASIGGSLSGQLKGLGAGIPTAEKLALRAAIADPTKVAALVDYDLPGPAKKIGKVDILADINGRLDGPSIITSITTLAARLKTEGTVRPFDARNMFDLGLSLKHDDMATLLKRLGINYTPSGKIGGLDLSTRLNGGLQSLAFSNLAAAVGSAQINGSGLVDMTGARPKVTANLNTGKIVVDPFLPAQKSALNGSEQPARVIPARFWVPNDTGRVDLKHLIATTSERWSTAPFDFAALSSADVDLNLTSPSVTYHEYVLEQAKLLSTIDAGVLRLKEFTGKVFDGQFASTAVVDASGKRPSLAGEVSVSGMDIGKASKAAGIASTTGELTTRINVNTLGNSVADWVGGLDGAGAINIKGVKGQTSLGDVPVIGVALGPLMQIFEVLNSGLGSLIGAGAKTGIGETDVNSTFTIVNGTLNTKDTQLISNLYRGNIAGDINLPLWSMNIGGDIAVDQGLVGTLLVNVVRLPSKIPFQLIGDIDKPNVKIESFSGSTSEGAGGIKVPGLEKLEKKAPGVGKLLQGILGGGNDSGATATPPAQTESVPPPQEPAPQQQTDPINQLLKGLLRK